MFKKFYFTVFICKVALYTLIIEFIVSYYFGLEFGQKNYVVWIFMSVSFPYT